MSFDYLTRQVMEDWDREVRAEMRRLIEEGAPPFDAAAIARDIVSARRKSRSTQEKSDV